MGSRLREPTCDWECSSGVAWEDCTTGDPKDHHDYICSIFLKIRSRIEILYKKNIYLTEIN